MCFTCMLNFFAGHVTRSPGKSLKLCFRTGEQRNTKRKSCWCSSLAVCLFSNNLLNLWTLKIGSSHQLTHLVWESELHEWPDFQGDLCALANSRACLLKSGPWTDIISLNCSCPPRTACRLIKMQTCCPRSFALEVPGRHSCTCLTHFRKAISLEPCSGTGSAGCVCQLCMLTPCSGRKARHLFGKGGHLHCGKSRAKMLLHV